MKLIWAVISHYWNSYAHNNSQIKLANPAVEIFDDMSSSRMQDYAAQVSVKKIPTATIATRYAHCLTYGKALLHFVLFHGN